MYSGARRQQCDAARITVDALRPKRLYRVEVGVHGGRGHREGIQHELVEQSVAHRLDAISLVQFRRRAPQVSFAIADVDAPPATSPDAAGGIGGLPRSPEIENQGLAAGSTR